MTYMHRGSDYSFWCTLKVCSTELKHFCLCGDTNIRSQSVSTCVYVEAEIDPTEHPM